MTKNCQHCGQFLSTDKPGVTIIDVAEDFRKNHPDVPKHLYLCPREECSKRLELIKTFEWYAGHTIVKG